MPIRGPVRTSRPAAARGRQEQERSRQRSAPFCVEADAERLGQLAGPRAELPVGPLARGGARICLEAGGRLERADQHRRRLALRLGDEVEQAVDAVGEVDVGAAGRAEEDLGARR